MFTRRLATGVGQVANGLFLTLTLGLAPDPRIDRAFSNLEHNIRFGIKRRFWRRQWNQTSLRLTAGTYRTRRGEIVSVRPNTEGWFDKLAFVVCHHDDHPSYTVDERGWAYPFADNLHKTPFDIVERV